ncbi:DUF4150 domain-containing protein [Agrobacterium vitis]
MSIPRDTYLGEPGYPDTWTTKKPREGLRDLDEAKIVSLSPDVCWTPCGSSVVAVPYPIVDFCGHDEGYTPSVRFTGKKAMVMRSRTTHVHNDKPGVKKGVKSGTVGDVCEPVGHADQVRAEGSYVIRHLDRFKMNKGNTDGEALFVRDTSTYAPPINDDPVPGSLRWTSGSDDGRVMSDASPEPLIMGAQYAQVAPATTPTVSSSPRTAPTAPPPTTYTDNVIQGPWEPKSPPVLEQRTSTSTVYGWLRRTGEFAAFAAIMLIPGDSPLIPPLPSGADPVEKDLNKRANDLLDPLNAKYNKEVQEWYQEQLLEYQEIKRKREEDQNKPAAVPVPENVRIEQEKEKQRCRVDTYRKMEPICRAIGMQAHHIVPDWTLRWGTRDEAITGQKRIDTMPGYWKGQSICVLGNARNSGTEHNEAHFADGAIETLGEHSNPLYTASLEDVKREAIIAMAAVRPHCAKQIIDAVNSEFANSNANQLLRAKQRVQDIPEATMKILSNGRYQK